MAHKIGVLFALPFFLIGVAGYHVDEVRGFADSAMPDLVRFVGYGLVIYAFVRGLGIVLVGFDRD